MLGRGDDLARYFSADHRPSAKRFWDALLNGQLLSDLKYSGTNFALGFVLAAVAGVVLGIIVGWYRHAEMLLGPFLSTPSTPPRTPVSPWSL